MANVNTDLTEEDAADLQFPKDATSQKPSTSSVVNVSDKSIILGYCSNCYDKLMIKYIFCDTCKLNICLQCFSNGSEFGNHKNNHDYRVLTTNFILFENSDWTAEEELRLLDSLMLYGNWSLVALDFPNRTLNEIKEHYEYFYLDRNGSPDMPGYDKEPEFPEIIVPYRFHLTNFEDPPRYASNTIGYQSLAGYNPARGDFENEYDKNAEDLLSPLETLDSDNPVFETLTDLQCAIVQSYNNRLKERQRRKTIIAQHGLLVLRKTISWLHRYDATITKPIYEKLMRFMHLCDPTKFAMLMEGLHRAGELKIRIQRLMLLRKAGITTLAEGRMYLKLQQIHEDKKKQLKLFRSNPQFNWKISKNATLELFPKFTKRRTSFAPLDIVGMPGYEKLTDKERDMCSTVRLVPATYLELKQVLIIENSKLGHVKLQTARRLLKIDVNKTRKLYDFLASEGYITKLEVK
ncbi:transcriptional adapter 2A [Rhynchophorus ferrugineus]|uniref:transcriptional adapter 2A n=1 Tax=Rhynchophorus ferrugineus TaxID=354439 RepID=UPI003FCD4405